jgi:hypothetical protein
MANGIVEFGGGFFLILFLFSICSHQVPNVFLKMLPIAPYILSHVVWPWFYFQVWNLERSEGRLWVKGSMTDHIFILE